MEYLKILGFFWEHKLMAVAPGWAALAIISWHLYDDVTDLEDKISEVAEATKALTIREVQKEFDRVATALCMNTGDPILIERRRQLQEEHTTLAGREYTPPECPLLLRIR